MTSAVRPVVGILTALGWLGVLCFGTALLIEPPGDGPVPGVRNVDLHEFAGSDDQPWSVVVLSDVQNGAPYLPELLRRAEAYAPRAVVISGDLAPDSKPALARIPVWYFRRRPTSVPLFIVPGNHDIARNEGSSPVGEREFVQWYGATTFDFRIGRTFFLGLDNSTHPIAGAALDAARMKLEAAKARGERTIVCLHRNIVLFDEPDKTVEDRNRELLELIRNYDVPYVVCGHIHQEMCETRGSTKFLAVPSSGHRPANEGGQKPIALTVLTWTGSSFEMRREEFYRRNWTELKGVVVYLSLAKIRPLFESRFGPAMAAGCVFLAVAGTGILLRRRKKAG